MKFWRKLLSVLTIAGAVVITGGAVYFQTASAATGSIYLSPSSKSVVKGSKVTLNIRITPGTAVNTVHVVLGYSTSKLQYSSSSYSGSPFSTQLGFSNSGGTISFDQADLSGTVSSDSFIASVTFKALVGSGSDGLSLSGSNSANNGVNKNPSTAGATISFTTPSTGGSSGGTSGGSSSGSGSSGSTTTSSSGSTTTKPEPTTKAKATAVTLVSTDVQYTLANFKLTSKAPTAVYIKYGADGKLTLKTKTTGYATSHDVAVTSGLVPGQQYSYQIISTNKQGVKTVSKVAEFTTKGLTISVGVFDKKHKALSHKKVVMHPPDTVAETDDNGFATFNDVSAGAHHIVYAVGTQTYDEIVMVPNNVHTVGGVQTAPLQNLAVVYNFAQKPVSTHSKSATWLVVGVVLAILAALIFLRRHLHMPMRTNNPVITTGGPVAPPQENLVVVTHPAGQQPGNTVVPSAPPSDPNTTSKV